MTRILVVFVALFVSLQTNKAMATEYYNTQAEAYAGCTSGPEGGGAYPFYWSPTVEWRFERCYQSSSNKYSCKIKQYIIADNTPISAEFSCGYSTTPGDGSHQWSVDLNCDASDPGNQGQFFTFDTPSAPAQVCSGGCEYSKDAGIEVCLSNSCGANYSTTGTECLGNEGAYGDEPEAPDGCSIQDGTIVCDCVANPAAPFCPGGGNDDDCDGGVCEGPGNDPFPDDPNDPGGNGGGSGDPTPDPGGDTGGNSGQGDGDPDSPGDGPGGGADDSSGTGDGDSDGDGDRDTDCNPLSTPDCPFSGSGNSSRSCDTPPSCTGDPVQCTILKQEWSSMCYPYRNDGSTIDPNFTEEILGVQEGQFFDGRTEEIDLASYATLDQSGYLGAAACPAPDTIQVLGQAFSIDWSPFCTAAEYLGFLVLIMASILSVRIIMGAF